LPSGAWFFRFAVTLPARLEYRVDTRPPTDNSPTPLEILLVEDLRRRLRETAEDIWQRTNRLLAKEATKPADQPAASAKSECGFSNPTADAQSVPQASAANEGAGSLPSPFWSGSLMDRPVNPDSAILVAELQEVLHAAEEALAVSQRSITELQILIHKTKALLDRSSGLLAELP
jgi:hypothetical protein